eukprot:2911784-Rhodomonas_salina.1
MESGSRSWRAVVERGSRSCRVLAPRRRVVHGRGERVVESGSLSWRAVHRVVHGRGEWFTELVHARQA